MKIALIGFGSMGQEIAGIVRRSKDFEIVSVSYKSRNDKLDIRGIQNADVAIDFTSADIVVENINSIFALGIPMVIGTTGWYHQVNKVKRIAKNSSAGLIYGQNFSVGANIFFKILAEASKEISKFKYDVYGLEIHHAKKKDSPSGTAKKLSEIVLSNFPKKTLFQTDKLNRQIQEEEFHFSSLRGGRNPGFHEIIFDSFADEIKLSHQAHNRSGFAEGALLAAKFIQNRKGIHLFDEVFTEGGDKS